MTNSIYNSRRINTKPVTSQDRFIRKPLKQQQFVWFGRQVAPQAQTQKTETKDPVRLIQTFRNATDAQFVGERLLFKAGLQKGSEKMETLKKAEEVFYKGIQMDPQNDYVWKDLAKTYKLQSHLSRSPEKTEQLEKSKKALKQANHLKALHDPRRASLRSMR